MISSGQVEFSTQHIGRWNEDEGGFVAVLCFASIGGPGSKDTREYVALPPFTKLHAKAQVTC